MLRMDQILIKSIKIENLNFNEPYNRSNMAMINLWPKPIIFFNQLLYYFGPVGPYIKWTWCLITPIILIVFFIFN